MKATEFEFRYRFWVIAAIFGVGFWCYAIDHVNACVALLQIILGHPLDFARASDRHAFQAAMAIAAIFPFAGAAIRTWAAAYLRSAVVHDPALHAEGLVADGPYRYTRNPLYLGVILMMLGYGLLASRLGWVVLNVGAVIFYLRLVGREEAALEASQGASYREYVAKVPRLWPSLRPRLPASGALPRWGQAFIGESFMWLIAADQVVYAATLSATIFNVILGVTLGGYVLVTTIIEQRKKRRAPETNLPSA
jgi:protein-S-isoprenylcysteine O-methyltransferase Ste14